MPSPPLVQALMLWKPGAAKIMQLVVGGGGGRLSVKSGQCYSVNLLLLEPSQKFSFLKGLAGDRKDFKALLQTSCVEISQSLRISVQSFPIINTPPGCK